MNRIQTQYRSASLHCVQNPKQAEVMERYRPQVAQACRSSPQIIKYVDDTIRAYRQNEKNSCLR